MTPRQHPPTVEETTDGILATPEINKNGTSLIGVIPATYEITSLGVPGIKNMKNVVIYNFLLSFKKVIFSNFCFDIKILTKSIPNFLANKKTTICPNKVPIKQRTDPKNHPKAYPDAISIGSPGIIATII